MLLGARLGAPLAPSQDLESPQRAEAGDPHGARELDDPWAPLTASRRDLRAAAAAGHSSDAMSASRGATMEPLLRASNPVADDDDSASSASDYSSDAEAGSGGGRRRKKKRGFLGKAARTLGLGGKARKS